MKIQKKYQGAIPLNRIANEHNGSEVNTYSTNYINNLVVNNLTTENPIYALGAAQGKILDGKINNVETKVSKISQNDMITKFTDFDDTTNYQTIQGYNTIIVKNGWCTVRCYLTVVSPAVAQTPILTVPHAMTVSGGMPHWQCHNWESSPSGIPLIIVITDDGRLNLRKGEAGVKYFINITYPIAE